jgi:hypothetical protein
MNFDSPEPLPAILSGYGVTRAQGPEGLLVQAIRNGNQAIARGWPHGYVG